MMGNKRKQKDGNKKAKHHSGFLNFIISLFIGTKDNSTLASRPWKNGWTYWCTFDLFPKWKGVEFDIYRGVAYHEREWWSKTDVVVRTFKTPGATHEDWSHFCRRSGEARNLVHAFNDHMRLQGTDVMVMFNTPALVVMNNVFGKRLSDDEVVAFEELLEGDFRTFVDDTGKMVTDESEVLHALCHYAYYHSNGDYILTNLKGVKNGPGNEAQPNRPTFYLTTPVFHSKSNLYGPTDRGQSGIQQFFKTHRCSTICQSFLPQTTACPVIQPTAPPYVSINQEMAEPYRNNRAAQSPPPSYEESQAMYWKHHLDK